MRTLSFSDPLPHRCTRIIVAGTSGAGKTTFAEQLACIQDLPRFEMDNLRWGPPRSAFLDEALAAASSDSWVTEWQYPAARPALARRARAMIWLDYSCATTHVLGHPPNTHQASNSAVDLGRRPDRGSAAYLLHRQ